MVSVEKWNKLREARGKEKKKLSCPSRPNRLRFLALIGTYRLTGMLGLNISQISHVPVLE